MERIEEFTQGGRNFIYIDLSGVKTNGEFAEIIEASKPIMQSYEGRDLYTVTNIEGITFDTKTKKLAAAWTEFNKPYVRYGVLIGVDSIKQLMVNAVFALSGRKNMRSAAISKEEAVEWLLAR